MVSFDHADHFNTIGTQFSEPMTAKSAKTQLFFYEQVKSENRGYLKPTRHEEIRLE